MKGYVQHLLEVTVSSKHDSVLLYLYIIGANNTTGAPTTNNSKSRKINSFMLVSYTGIVWINCAPLYRRGSRSIFLPSIVRRVFIAKTIIVWPKQEHPPPPPSLPLTQFIFP